MRFSVFYYSLCMHIIFYLLRYFLPFIVNTYFCPIHFLPSLFRYEGKDDLYDRAHQNADWGGGGLVSNLRDMCKFMRSLAIVKPKAVSNTPSFFNDLNTLKAMISNRVNTGDDGMYYLTHSYS